jgi:hypothetical protein
VKLQDGFALNKAKLASPRLATLYSRLWDKLKNCGDSLDCYRTLFECLIEAVRTKAAGNADALAEYVSESDVRFLNVEIGAVVNGEASVKCTLSQDGVAFFKAEIDEQAEALETALKKQKKILGNSVVVPPIEQLREEKAQQIRSWLLVSLMDAADSLLASMPLIEKEPKSRAVSLFMFKNWDALARNRALSRPYTGDPEPRPIFVVELDVLRFFHVRQHVFYYWAPEEPALDVKEVELAKELSGDRVRKSFFWCRVWQTSGSGTTAFLVWLPKSGGHGIGRADNVEPENHLWRHAAPDYPELGAIIGLDPMRAWNVALAANGANEAPSGKAPRLRKISPGFIASGPWLATSVAIADDEEYVRVNLPRAKVLGSASSSVAAKILSIFEFFYYRRLGENRFFVLKTTREIKNRPGLHDGVSLGLKDRFGVGPPIDISNNYAYFKQSKSGRPVIKNKGSELFIERSARKGAGGVMKSLPKHLDKAAEVNRRNFDQYSLSASTWTAAVMRGKGGAWNDWELHRRREPASIPTDQEWCHLKGHGDGGDERVGNFVSGSFHCNTEQLAIESGQRIVTQAAGGARYVLKTSAYLWDDRSMNGLSAYLTALDPKYMEKAYGENPTSREQGKREKFAADRKRDLARVARAAPIAAFICYKVYRQRSNAPDIKVFDYAYEGQSEFFDQNQYRIVNATVAALLRHHADPDLDRFNAWYREQVAALEAKRRESKVDDSPDGTQKKGGSSMSDDSSKTNQGGNHQGGNQSGNKNQDGSSAMDSTSDKPKPGDSSVMDSTSDKPKPDDSSAMDSTSDKPKPGANDVDMEPVRSKEPPRPPKTPHRLRKRKR